MGLPVASGYRKTSKASRSNAFHVSARGRVADVIPGAWPAVHENPDITEVVQSVNRVIGTHGTSIVRSASFCGADAAPGRIHGMLRLTRIADKNNRLCLADIPAKHHRNKNS